MPAARALPAAGGSKKHHAHHEKPAQLSVEDVVRAVAWVLTAPPHVEVNDIVLRAIPQQGTGPAAAAVTGKKA